MNDSIDIDGEQDTADIEEAGRPVPIKSLSGNPRLNPDGSVAQMQIRGVYSHSFVAAQNRVAARNRLNVQLLTEEQIDADNREIWASAVASWPLLIAGKPAPPEVVFKRKPEILADVVVEARKHTAFSPAVLTN